MLGEGGPWLRKDSAEKGVGRTESREQKGGDRGETRGRAQPARRAGGKQERSKPGGDLSRDRKRRLPRGQA